MKCLLQITINKPDKKQHYSKFKGNAQVNIMGEKRFLF